MRAFIIGTFFSILLPLAATTETVANEARDELEALVFRSAPLYHLAERSPFDPLFPRSSSNCTVGFSSCTSGTGCVSRSPTLLFKACSDQNIVKCRTGTTCCLSGCCQESYSCQPEQGQSKPCVCFGSGCPNPSNGGPSASPPSPRQSGGSTKTSSGHSSTASNTGDGVRSVSWRAGSIVTLAGIIGLVAFAL